MTGNQIKKDKLSADFQNVLQKCIEDTLPVFESCLFENNFSDNEKYFFALGYFTISIRNLLKKAQFEDYETPSLAFKRFLLDLKECDADTKQPDN